MQRVSLPRNSLFGVKLWPDSSDAAQASMATQAIARASGESAWVSIYAQTLQELSMGRTSPKREAGHSVTCASAPSDGKRTDQNDAREALPVEQQTYVRFCCKYVPSLAGRA